MEQFVHEAENLTYYHASVEMAHSGYTGTGYVDGYYYDMDAFVEFEDASFGRNDIYLGIVFANEHSRPCELIVNGEVMDTVSFQGTGWGDWILAPVHIQSSSDISSIRLEPISRHGLPNIDKFIIAYENDVPEGARKVTFDGGWNEANTPYSSFDGINTGEFIDIDSGKYSGFEFILYLDEDDTVDLTCRYACPEDMPAQILVNGVIQNVTMPFVSTGAWDNWNSASTYIGLDKGVNTIRIEALNDSGLPMIENLDAIAYVFALGLDIEKFQNKLTPILSYQTEGNELCFNDMNYMSNNGYSDSYFIVDYSNPSNKSTEITVLLGAYLDMSETSYQFNAVSGINNHKVWINKLGYPTSSHRIRVFSNDPDVQINGITLIRSGVSFGDCEEFCPKDTIYEAGNSIGFQTENVHTKIFEIEYKNNTGNDLVGKSHFYGEYGIDTIQITYKAEDNGVAKGYLSSVYMGVNSFVVDSVDGIEITAIKIIGCELRDEYSYYYYYPYEIYFDGGWNEAHIPYSSFDGENTGEYINIDEGIHSGYEFIIYAENSTKVGVWSRYASPEDLPAQVLVNGVNTGKSFEYKSTGTWGNWNEDVCYFELQKGINTVRIEALTEGGLPMIKDLALGAKDYVLGIDAERLQNTLTPILYYQTETNEICFDDMNYMSNNGYSDSYFIVDYSNPSNKSAEITVLLGAYLDMSEMSYQFNAVSGINKHKVWINEFGYPTYLHRVRAFSNNQNVQIDGMTLIRNGVEFIDCEEFCPKDTIYEAGDSIRFETYNIHSKIYEIEYVNTSGEEQVGKASYAGGECGSYSFDISYKAEENGVIKGNIPCVDIGCSLFEVEPVSGVEIIGVSIIGCELSSECYDHITGEVLKSDLIETEENLPEAINDVKVNPTATSREVTIIINSQKEYDASITVLNSSGVPVIQKNMKVKSGENSYDINVEEFSVGAYQVIIVGDGKYAVKQFVVE